MVRPCEGRLCWQCRELAVERGLKEEGRTEDGVHAHGRARGRQRADAARAHLRMMAQKVVHNSAHHMAGSHIRPSPHGSCSSMTSAPLEHDPCYILVLGAHNATMPCLSSAETGGRASTSHALPAHFAQFCFSTAKYQHLVRVT
jgi:hypothetical protein